MIEVDEVNRPCAQLWKGCADFLKAITVQSVQIQLNNMERVLKKDGVDKNSIKEVKKSCKEFFMELVSDLCFGGQAVPEPNLIKMLLDRVFIEKNDSTQELTPYKDDRADKIPTIRSFLLQLLLEHRCKSACYTSIILCHLNILVDCTAWIKCVTI